MKRRDFLKYASAISAASLGTAHAATISSTAEPTKKGWKTFELITKVDFDASRGKSKIWLPVPTHVETDYQIPLGNTWKGNYTEAALRREPVYRAEALFAEWNKNDEGVHLELVSKVAVAERTVDLERPRQKAGPLPQDVAFFLKGTPSSPTDGIVLSTAQKIVGSKQGGMAKAQAVYDWILENGVRDPNVEGCGTGDVIAMLETGNISGKCADLNGLFVALVRSVGVPARDVYGIRAGESKFFKTLGKSGDISKSQHCKAEFYLPEFGWIPVDPADVLKVSLEERLPIEAPQVVSERARQFGSWEGNWVTYNTARDFKPNPPTRTELEFLMYPRAETEKGVLNALDPKAFGFAMLSGEIRA